MNDTVQDADYTEVDEEGQAVTPGNEVAVRQAGAVAVQETMTLEALVAQVELIQGAMTKVMKVDEHYGTIPGTGKPTLYKPGAEKLLLLFRLAPEYDIEREQEGNHLTAWVTCRLTHIPTGTFVGSGAGSCSTKESKYATRAMKRACPVCNVAAIIKGKVEYGGGWLCWKKATPNAGCGAKFPDGDPRIEGQAEGQVENPDLPDLYNTVIKMGCKRALVAAVLNATAASDIFTQDMEDSPQAAAQAPVQANQGSAGNSGRETAGAPQEEAKADPAEQARIDAGRALVRDGIVKLAGRPGWSEVELVKAAQGSWPDSNITSIDDLGLQQLRSIYKGMIDHGGLNDLPEATPKPQAKTATVETDMTDIEGNPITMEVPATDDGPGFPPNVGPGSPSYENPEENA